MLSSSLTTLLLLLAGLVAGVVILASLLPRGPRVWLLAAVAAVFVALAAFTPGAAREGARGLDYQRTLNAGTSEIAARERCLNDIGRPELRAAAAFTRERIPEDARFLLRTNSQIRPCFTLNVLPRLPANEDDFDPERDWIVYDRAIPAGELENADRDLVYSDTFFLVRPEGG